LRPGSAPLTLSLKSARLAVDEARGRYHAAGRLANPTAGVEYQNQSKVSPSALSFSIDQSFPVTRRLAVEKKLSAQLVAAELEVREVERRLIAEAQSLAVQILATQEKRALGRKQGELATKLSKFRHGEGHGRELSPLDATQARVDAQRLRVEALQWENESVSLLGTLKPMLGLAPVDHLTITGELPAVTVPRAIANLSRRPDLALAQTKAAAAETEVELSRENKWQDFTAGIFAAHEEQLVSPSNTEHTGFAGLRLSIPLPLWNQNQGEIAEKSASAQRARLEKEALTQTILSEAETARKEMLAQAELIRETRDELLPLLADQAAELERAYGNGQTDLLTVLRAGEQRLRTGGFRPRCNPRIPPRPHPLRGRHRAARPSPKSLIRCDASLLIPSSAWLSTALLQPRTIPSAPRTAVVLDETGVKNLGIETVETAEADFEETVFALGNIDAIPDRVAAVSSRVSGRMVELKTIPGDVVKKDQEVAKIESRQPGNPPPMISLIAPIGGLVTRLDARLGDPVEPEHALMEITDLSEVYAIACVPEHFAGRMKPGTVAHITAAALPDQKFDGELLRFGTSAGEGKRDDRRGVPDAEPGRLAPGGDAGGVLHRPEQAEQRRQRPARGVAGRFNEPLRLRAGLRVAQCLHQNAGPAGPNE